MEALESGLGACKSGDDAKALAFASLAAIRLRRAFAASDARTARRHGGRKVLLEHAQDVRHAAGTRDVATIARTLARIRDRLTRGAE